MRRFVNVRRNEIKKARIEIIPMIDAIFFLLVFFMMSSLSMVRLNGMGVSLPKASAATSLPPPRMIVTVDKAGDYYLNIDPIQPAAIQAALQERVSAKPETVIVVNVEKSHNVQTLISVMDIVNSVKKPNGEQAAVMIATTPINARGEALEPAAATAGGG